MEESLLMKKTKDMSTSHKVGTFMGPEFFILFF